jgi:hypothetical protein
MTSRSPDIYYLGFRLARPGRQENPAAGGAGGGVFNGRFAKEGCVLDPEPSVETKMTRRKEKWSVLGYRPWLTLRNHVGCCASATVETRSVQKPPVRL